MCDRFPVCMPEPATTIIVGGVVLKQNGRYLLVQEAKEHVRGKWNLPGGKTNPGETVEECAIREALEETGYSVELIRKVGVYQNAALDDAVKHAFEAKIIGGELDYPKDELLDAQWFTFQEVERMKEHLRHPSVFEAIMDVENSQ